ncbi:MAG: hypothetical protein AAFZ65_11025, partial [Planctomycetota bacterium]
QGSSCAAGAGCGHVQPAGCEPAAPLVVELESTGRDSAGRASIGWSATPLVDLVSLEVSAELPDDGRLRYTRGERAEILPRGARTDGELGLEVPLDSRVDLVFLATFVDPQSATGTSTARIDRRVEYGAPRDVIDAVLTEAEGELLLIAPSSHRPSLERASRPTEEGR